MSPLARALKAKLDRLLRQYAPGFRSAVLKAYRDLQGAFSEARLARILRTQGAAGVVAAVVEQFEVASVPVREGLRTTMEGAAKAFQRDLPKVARVGVAFDVLNPEVLAALRTMETRVMTGLTEALATTVREHVAAGLVAGQNPTVIARGLRPLLPLAPNQANAIRNFERMLREGDSEALTRALRDKRFDSTVKRAFAGQGLSEAQVTRMTGAYRKRMMAFNANTIARTSTLDALRQGQRASWVQAADVVGFDRGLLMKERVTVGDSRVREDHAEINGQTVPFDVPYTNGEIVSGDQSYNCRCIDRYFLRAA